MINKRSYIDTITHIEKHGYWDEDKGLEKNTNRELIDIMAYLNNEAPNLYYIKMTRGFNNPMFADGEFINCLTREDSFTEVAYTWLHNTAFYINLINILRRRRLW